MQQYTGFFILLGLILIIVISSRSLRWWIKTTMITYYFVLSYIFISTKNKIDKQFENIVPVPDEYWDKNSEWVSTIAGFLFWPLALFLIFLYFKWFTKANTRIAKVLVFTSIIPAAAIFIFFAFLFDFSYGYRP
ncbi:hypothetical protein [Metabacillus litoralis]|uniref:hypothetical protein n=1 Tax=Metabacillus litoralis TaxID=152268 RepID=UPI00203E7A4D|nr:hypothetical protein [Metabacillus litoralis]MCM3409496.1 hypothetical protein [Metabacillus litoralis]